MTVVVTITDLEISGTGFGDYTELRPVAEGTETDGPKSGCMRGNDRYSCNGSASVGYYATREEPAFEHESYNDFIIFNYGNKQDRQHMPTSKATAKNKRFYR